ncbi:hypothetical protein V6Z11_A11G127500 [Gossypium hirsutum]|uniref:Wee1-like protein kinase n=1 Tax=Gossypium hirsutum TaxID=3635 RepID=A0ABM2Z2R7_GOSHI|nr:wee1-like protein kinase [Gossypium hirsutum]
MGGLLLVPFLEMVLINPTWRRVRMVCRLPSNQMKATLEKHFQVQFHHHQSSSAISSSIFTQSLLDFGCRDDPFTSVPNLDAAIDKDFIVSQDFFCTPDYITPDHQT